MTDYFPRVPVYLLAVVLVADSVAYAAIKIDGSQLVTSGDGYSAPAETPPAAGVTSPGIGLVFQFGQPIAGRVSVAPPLKSGTPSTEAPVTPAEVGAGLSYDIAQYVFGAFVAGGCPVALTGDVNESENITSGDIIYLVNYVFKAGPAPLPIAQSGDVNCSGSVSSADIIELVNFVFKGTMGLCDVCTTL